MSTSADAKEHDASGGGAGANTQGERLRRRLENEGTLRKLLQTVGEPLSLKDVLEKCLDILLATSWLSVLPKGGVFVVGEKKDQLELVAQRDLSPPLLTLCAKVPFGHCLCGRAALKKRILHAACVDERHDIAFEGMQPHGHYNVPIMDGSTVIGVIVLYLAHGHERDEDEVAFLDSVAEILSLVIRLKKYQGDLEDMVEERTARYMRAMQRAEIANRAKTEFLNHVSYELNTPLNSIIAFSDIILEEMMGPIGNETYTEHLKSIRQAGQDLKALIGNIVEMSEFELGKLKLQEDEVPVDEILEFPLKLVRAQHRDLNLEISCTVANDAGLLRCDKVRLRQVLMNLLDNAVKYTESGGRVDVTAGRDENGCIVISVADTGVGIERKDIPRLADPFFRVQDNPYNKTKAAGLGLTLARYLIEAHGGVLEIASAKGRGTTVRMRFPKSRTVNG